MRQKLCAWILLLSLLLPVMCSCSSSQSNGEGIGVGVSGEKIADLDRISTKTAPAPKYPSYNGSDTVRIGLSSAELKLSPLFACSISFSSEAART